MKRAMGKFIIVLPLLGLSGQALPKDSTVSPQAAQGRPDASQAEMDGPDTDYFWLAFTGSICLSIPLVFLLQKLSAPTASSARAQAQEQAREMEAAAAKAEAAMKSAVRRASEAKRKLAQAADEKAKQDLARQAED